MVTTVYRETLTKENLTIDYYIANLWFDESGSNRQIKTYKCNAIATPPNTTLCNMHAYPIGRPNISIVS